MCLEIYLFLKVTLKNFFGKSGRNKLGFWEKRPPKIFLKKSRGVLFSKKKVSKPKGGEKQKMKTVKIKNELPSKIEPTNFASIINDMPRVKTQSPQMTAPQAESFGKSKDIIDNYNAQKKLQETYIKLKQNLEACREAKPTSFITVADQKSIDYFEGIGNQLSNTLLSLQQEKEITLQNFQNKIETAKRMLEELEQKMKVKEKKIDDKILIQNNRIQANQLNLERAKERTKQVKKTKEEIKLEKQLQQLLIDFKRTNPEKDLEYYFPNYKILLGSTLLAPPQMDPPLPSVETNKNLVVEPEPEEEEEEKEEEEDFTELTPWKRFQKANSYMSLYNQYHKAKEMGIEPEIEEPEKPISKRQPRKKTTETVSRESLAKILPSYA